MQIIETGRLFLRRLVKQAGPYVLLELLLPGGTLFALLLLIYRSGALTALQPMPVICPQSAQIQVLRTAVDPMLRARVVVCGASNAWRSSARARQRHGAGPHAPTRVCSATQLTSHVLPSSAENS